MKCFTAFHQQLKCFNHECQKPIAHSVFKQTVLTQCPVVAATQSKSVAKWYKFLINELLKQIILYCGQNSLSARHYIGQLCYVSLIVSQHSDWHMIIHWHIHMVHFLLFLHQNCSLVTGSLKKLYFLPRDAMLRAVYAVVVCLWVCLSHSGIVSKRLNVGSRK